VGGFPEVDKGPLQKNERYFIHQLLRGGVATKEQIDYQYLVSVLTTAVEILAGHVICQLTIRFRSPFFCVRGVLMMAHGSVDRSNETNYPKKEHSFIFLFL
jgi:hypothetical protein